MTYTGSKRESLANEDRLHTKGETARKKQEATGQEWNEGFGEGWGMSWDKGGENY